MHNNKHDCLNEENEPTDNVVALFPKPEMVDPLQNELLLEACRNFFARGVTTPSGLLTDYVNNMSATDRREYGLNASILLARSPCLYKTHADIYLQFLQDGRLPRICQFVFCAFINKRELTTEQVESFLGIVGQQMTFKTNRTTQTCVELLVGQGLMEIENGKLLCTRKLGYYVIEMVAFLADALHEFAVHHRDDIATAWNAPFGELHSTYWLPINAPLSGEAI